MLRTTSFVTTDNAVPVTSTGASTLPALTFPNKGFFYEVGIGHHAAGRRKKHFLRDAMSKCVLAVPPIPWSAANIKDAPIHKRPQCTPHTNDTGVPCSLSGYAERLDLAKLTACLGRLRHAVLMRTGKAPEGPLSILHDSVLQQG
jgi:hypothetical protein